MLKITILTDNRVRKRGLVGEHGLSLWIQRDSQSILFDTGQSSVFLRNAQKLGIPLETADHVVISHGHYDHCGGLRHLPRKNKTQAIYAHPDAFSKKFFSGDRGQSREVGLPLEISGIDWVRERMIYIREPLQIEEGVLISGEIPCSHTFEEAPQGFLMEKDGMLMHDLILDEQMLIMEDEHEMALFLGCSHRGIINSINYAKRLVPDKSIKLLIAGMHLENASSTRLQKTIEQLLDFKVQKVIPLHCTGFGAMCEMKRALGERCLTLCAGDEIEV